MNTRGKLIALQAIATKEIRRFIVVSCVPAYCTVNHEAML